jgi:hypothetical protein
VEHTPRDLRNVGEDVPRAGSVFSTLKTRTELTVRVEDVEVVGSDEGLGETDDGSLERGVTVMVGGVLGDVSGELTDLQRDWSRTERLVGGGGTEKERKDAP